MINKILKFFGICIHNWEEKWPEKKGVIFIPVGTKTCTKCGKTKTIYGDLYM